MTRKNLSDLVRHEAQKPTGEVAGEVAGESVHNPDGSQKTELEVIAAKLKDVLANAKNQEDHLQSEISQLKSKLQDQENQILSLRTKLEQTTKLEQDFKEAKATILKLTQANQLANQLASQQASSAKPVQVTQARPEPVIFNSYADSDIGSWLG